MKATVAILFTILAVSDSQFRVNPIIHRFYDLLKDEYIIFGGEVMKFKVFYETTIETTPIDLDRYRFLNTTAFQKACDSRRKKFMILVAMYGAQIVELVGDGSMNDTILELILTALDAMLHRTRGKNDRDTIRHYMNNLKSKYPEKFMKRLRNIITVNKNHIPTPTPWSNFDTTDRLTNMDFFGTLCVDKDDYVVDLFKPEIMTADRLLESLKKIVQLVCDQYKYGP